MQGCAESEHTKTPVWRASRCVGDVAALLLWVAAVRLSSLQCVHPNSEPLSSHDPLLAVQHVHRSHLLSLQSQTLLITTDDTTSDSSYNQNSSLVEQCCSPDVHTLFFVLFFTLSLPLSTACALSGSVPVLCISAEARAVEKRQLFSEVCALGYLETVCGIHVPNEFEGIVHPAMKSVITYSPSSHWMIFEWLIN